MSRREDHGRFKDEAELASVVERWLLGLGYEVYKEVVPFRGSHRADIVAVMGKIVWVVECKLSSSLAVIDQATKWKFWAHKVSVAVESKSGRSGNGFFAHVCGLYGVGVMDIKKKTHEDGQDNVWEAVPPKMNRVAESKFITRALFEAQKHNVAGSKGSYATAFNETVREMKDYLKEHPGATMKEVIDNIETHYSSKQTARASLSHWILKGVIKGVTRKRDGKMIKLYLTNSDGVRHK